MSAATTVISAPATPSRVYDQPTPVEIDFSCRKTLMLLFTKSVFWLVVSLLLSVLASIKLHGPGMFADMPGLTYGRLSAAASSTFLYGFASQAGIAIALWLLSRLGRTLLVFGGGALVGGLFWNLGVLVGVIGIFYGNTTGYDRFEMPLYTAPILFIAYSLLGISGLVTYHARTERESYPTTWFVLAAFFVFPWIYSIAALLLGDYAARGPMQPIVAQWYGNNFVTMWLAPLALGVIFYFVSKLSQQPLHSYGTAAFAFWGYVFIAHASGFQSMHSVPNWLPALSSAINLFLMPLVIYCLAWNWYKTWAGHGSKIKEKASESKYVVISVACFIGAGLLTALASLHQVNNVIGFTIYQMGLAQLVLFGFITMAFFAAMIHIIPRLTDIDWPLPAFSKLHYSLSLVGILSSVLALIAGGWLQGNNLNNPSVPFMDTVRRTIPFIGISTLGLILLLAAQVLFLGNLGAMFKVCCATCCGSRKEVAR